jgi:Fe-S-cluster containining protein
MVIEDPEKYAEGCRQCGLCCKVFGDRITPTVMNLYTWMEGGRTGILRHFSVCLGEKKFARADHITQSDLHDVTSIELRDPETGGYVPVCPFLHRDGRNRYLCTIHDDKPDMCCNYMPWVWGETYFPRCKALDGIEKQSYLAKVQEKESGNPEDGI